MIGSEVDQGQTTQSAIDRQHVLASTIKRYDAAVVEMVRAFLDGELESGEVVLGLGDGGVGLAPTVDNLEALGIAGPVKNVEGEMSIDHIPFQPYASNEPSWQIPADVSIFMEMGRDYCQVVEVRGADEVAGEIRVPRGTRVRAHVDSVTDEVSGIGMRVVDHGTTVAGLTEEAQTGIPSSFGEALAISVIAPQGASAVSAVMDGTPFVPNCFVHEPDYYPSDFLPVIVKPSS